MSLGIAYVLQHKEKANVVGTSNICYKKNNETTPELYILWTCIRF